MHMLMRNTMGTLFLFFGIIKLIDINAFVDIFVQYDLLGSVIRSYGYMYPFIEIILGISLFMLHRKYMHIMYIVIILLMTLSLTGVLRSMSYGQSLRCGCLGAYFHIPLSYVTVSENVAMIVMSIYMLHNTVHEEESDVTISIKV